MQPDFPKEICHNITPVFQLYPVRNAGGDCFACAATAALNYLLPDEKINFDKVYSIFETKCQDGSPYIDNTWWGMQSVLRSFGQLAVATHISIPRFKVNTWSHCFYNGNTRDPFYIDLRMIIENGGIALTEIDFHGRGGTFLVDERLIRNHANHFVLLDGVRWLDSLDHEVHVIDSVKGAYWISISELQWKFGAAGWIIAKNKEYNDPN